MSSSHQWLYAFACVIIPVAWGLLIVWVSNRLEPILFHRSRHPAHPDNLPVKPLEYHI